MMLPIDELTLQMKLSLRYPHPQLNTPARMVLPDLGVGACGSEEPEYSKRLQLLMDITALRII